MIEGKENIIEFFNNNPKMKKVIEKQQIQYKCWEPKFEYNRNLCFRKMTVDDVHFITYGAWGDEKGIYAWYYVQGVPHYLKIGELE